MRMRIWRLAALLALAWGLAAPALAAIPVYDAEVVRAYPHDPAAFTEGLFYHDGALYESTGLEGQSTLRKVELATGRVLRSRALDSQYFGEGIVPWKGRLIQLTWVSHVGFVYDLATFAPIARFTYPGEGWALTEDGRDLIMSDGTPVLRFLDPDTLKPVRRLTVTADGVPLRNINELEWVKGQILANVWMTRRIARIDPATGRVTAWIDLGRLVPPDVAGDADAVANGIAWDAQHDRLFVTGKRWPRLFEIHLVRRTTPD
jgi:glutaminyl-peptide cyclotransferase